MRAGTVSGSGNVTSGGSPRAVRRGGLRVRRGVGRLGVRYLGRVQQELAVRAQLDVRWGARVVGSLGQAEGGCEDNLERGREGFKIVGTIIIIIRLIYFEVNNLLF